MTAIEIASRAAARVDNPYRCAGKNLEAFVEIHWREYREDITTILTALEAEGMVVVPREPTWGMQIAGRDAILADDDDLDISTDDARASYRAMIAAAQGGDDAGQ